VDRRLREPHPRLGRRALRRRRQTRERAPGEAYLRSPTPPQDRRLSLLRACLQEAILRSADATQRPVLTAQIYLERITDERHYRVPLPPLPEEPSAGPAARGTAKQEAEAAAKRATAQRAAAEDRASDASLPAWSASAGPDASVDLDASDVWSVGSAPTQRTPLLSAAIESQLEAERAAWPEHRDVHLRLDVVRARGSCACGVSAPRSLRL